METAATQADNSHNHWLALSCISRESQCIAALGFGSCPQALDDRFLRPPRLGFAGADCP